MRLGTRLLVITVLAGVLSMAIITPALAHVCFNPNKPDGAGSAGSATLLIDPATGEETFIPGSDLQMNEHSGRVQGGFVTLTAVIEGVGPIATADVFAQTTLPEQARNAGPGDNLCDGKGVDDAAVCHAP